MPEQTESQPLGFAMANFDWANYTAHRPRYPPSLYSLIYTYHDQHSSDWTLAHDAGSGPGILAAQHASRFSRVAVSDPNAAYIAAARRALADVVGRFSFTVAGAETSWLEQGSVQMFSLAEAFHWTVPEDMVAEAARQLGAGGTFVCVYYSGVPLIVGNEDAARAWEGLHRLWVMKGVRSGSEAVKKGYRACVRGLDGVGLPRVWFEDVRRVKINSEYRGEDMFWERMNGIPQSLVGEEEVIDEVQDLEGWSVKMDMQGLMGLFASHSDVPKSEGEKYWIALENAIGKSKVKLVWATEIVLATRRSTGFEEQANL